MSIASPLASPLRALARTALLSLVALGLLPAVQAATGQTLSVTTNADGGAGSLRAAVAQANGDTNDTITFTSGVTSPITLTTGELLITGGVTISGPGASALTVSGNNASRVFHVSGGRVTISGLTITKGSVANGGGGGLLVDGAGAVTVSACTLTANASTFGGNGAPAGDEGGAIANNGTLTVTGSTFSSNTASLGGAIYNASGMTVSGSTFTGNTANFGGAVFNTGGVSASLATVTFSSNSAGAGGAIFSGSGTTNSSALLSIVGGIFTSNTASGNVAGTTDAGGAISTGVALSLTGCTFTSNSATALNGGALGVSNGTTTVSGCTFSGDAAPAGAGGAIDVAPSGSGVTAEVDVDTTTITGGSALTGGGINVGGTLALVTSTVSANQAAGNGAAGGGGLLVMAGATAGLTNDTLSGNSASAGNGGGVDSAGALSLTSVTVASNAAPSGLSGGIAAEAGGTATLQGTIDATNTAGTDADAAGAFTSSGSNLIGDGAGATGFTGAHDQVGTTATPINPALGPLTSNGGATPTRAISATSPALNADYSANPPATDQRGIGRPVGPRADVGAYEAPSPPAGPTNLTAMPGYKRIVLSFVGTANASGYNVYRGASPGGENLTNPINGATPVRGTRYVDLNLTDGTVYYYVVKAVNVVGESPASNEASATPLDVRVRGSVLAWGDNTTGDLGTGDFLRSLFPKAVIAPSGVAGPLENVVQVAGGAGFSLALTADGKVYSWGDDTYGQLGDGNTAAYDQQSGGTNGVLRRDTPDVVLATNPQTFSVQPLRGIVAIAAGREFALALGANGVVYAWGRNQLGQLGNGTNDAGSAFGEPSQDYAYANPVLNGTTGNPLTRVAGIAGGGFHALAVMSDGTVLAWGSNTVGQLGNGTSGPGTDSFTPTQVSALVSAASVAAGQYHSLAVDSSGSVFAWGYDQDGELGDGGGGANQTTPQPVSLPGTLPVTQIAAGQYHSLALLSDGSVTAWGSDSNGQIGDGNAQNFFGVFPTTVLSGALSLGAGAAFSQAVVAGHTLDAFGANSGGQLGLGTTTDSSTPVGTQQQGGGLQPYLYAAAGGATHALAIQNLPPTIVRQSYTVSQFGRTVNPPGLLVGAADAEGDGPLSVLTVTSRATAHGTVSVRADGSFTYTPTAGYQGGDVFTYQVTDGLGVSTPATVTLTVTPLVLKSLAVTPQSPSIPESGTQQFTVTGTFNDGSTQTFTTAATWTSSDTTVATISNTAPTQGLATASASKPGTTTITAAYGGLSATATLTVVRTLRTLTVQPATPTLDQGLTLPFTATGLYTDGATADLTQQVTWSPQNGSVARVSNAAGSKGVATAVSPGTTPVTALDPSSGISGQTTLTVTGPVLESLTVTPVGATISRGGNRAYTAVGVFSDGSTQDYTQAVTWASLNPNVATVDISGLVTGDNVGSTQITATVSVTDPATNQPKTVTGQAGVSVVNPNVTPRSHVLFNLNGGQISLWDIDTAFNVNETLYGPYFDAPGNLWTAAGVATGPDGLTHVLWNNPDGKVILWARTTDATGAAAVEGIYGPYGEPGRSELWRATAVSVGADNVVHILWNHPDGRVTLWYVNPDGSYGLDGVYGPYGEPGSTANWSAKTIATGPDNVTHILWTHPDGRATIWYVNPDGSYGLLSSDVFGPYTDNGVGLWNATSLSVGTDGAMHLLWNNTDGRVAYWNLDLNQNPTIGGYGPYAGWSALAVSTGPQNDSHVLWGKADGTIAYWDINTSDFSVNYKIYSPGAGYAATALSTGP